MKKTKAEILIVGGGPSGLALAAELKKKYSSNIILLERESIAGGIPRHTFHPGYGIRDLHKFMSGPKYANYYVNLAKKLGVEILTSTTAFDWVGANTLATTSPNGLLEISADKIILATGARERARNSRLIPGSRPEGLFTTGSLQQTTYLNHQYVGSKAVIIGSEHVSYSALMTLHHAGVKTVAMVESNHKTQSFGALVLPTKIRYGYKFFTNSKLVRIEGKGRVSSVVIERNQELISIPCDTVVFTGNWIPDNELARRGNLEIDLETKSPMVNSNFETSQKNIYAIGNLLMPIKSADQCVLETRKIDL